MERLKHAGKSWSCSFLTGRETRKVFRWVDKESHERVSAVGSFVGRLLDVTSGEEVGELHCGWLANGDIEVIFPDMGVGRYVIAIDFASQTGKVSRFLDGYAGYLTPGYVIEEAKKGEETIVTVCGAGEGSEVWALAGEAGNYMVEDAIEAAEKAEQAKNDALEALELAQKFMDSFNKALSEAIQVKGGYLYINGVNTGEYLRGQDGVTPRYGADGWWYVGDTRVGKARGDDGITPHITADGYWAFGDKKTSVRAKGIDGINGSAMRRKLITSVSQLPATEERGVYYYLRKSSGAYDVYLWLEPAGWVNVGEHEDIATTLVHGFVRLPGGELEEGSPVGWDKDAPGDAMVPMSGTALAGAGKVGSTGLVKEDCAKVGLSADGTYCVPQATADSFGSAKLSTTEALNANNSGPIGIGAEKELRARMATINDFGTIKLGSEHVQSTRNKYMVGIGAINNPGARNHGQLANNYVFGGALQHRRPGEWRGTMQWLDKKLDDEEDEDTFASSTYYSGFLHTVQFTQDEETGLKLLPVTETGDLPGGVFIASGMYDEREAAVLTGEVVLSFLNEHYYNKESLYTKTETANLINSKVSAYVPMSLLLSEYVSESVIQSLLANKMGLYNPDRGNRIAFLTADERNALTSIDSKTAYLIYV